MIDHHGWRRANPAVPRYREADLRGYDAVEGAIHLYSVTNAGDVHDHQGGRLDDTITLELARSMDGAAFVEDIVVTFKCASEFTLTDTTLVGGQAVTRLSGTFRQQ